MAFVGPPVRFQWPQTGCVVAMYFGSAENTDTELAHLEIAITDDQTEDIFASPLGQGPVLPIFVRSLSLVGKGRRWFKLNRWVMSGDVWTFRVRETFAGPPVAVVPELLFDLEPGEWPLHLKRAPRARCEPLRPGMGAGA